MCEYGFSGEFRIKKHQDIYTDESGLTLDHQWMAVDMEKNGSTLDH